MVSCSRSLFLVSALVLCSQGQGKRSLTEVQNKASQDARCSLFGHDRIQTFDGKFYEFPGHCSYKLAGDCIKNSFSLLGNYQNGKRKSITLYLGEYFEVTVTLKGDVSVGKKRIQLPFTTYGVYIGTEAGYHIISSNEHGFTARIDTSENVAITLSKKYFSRTCGLCGNYNHFPQDDYLTQEGFQVKNSFDFANSWAMGGAEELCSRVSAPSKTCTMSGEAIEMNLIGKCKMLKIQQVFKKCNDLVDPEPFIASCEDDTCHCERKDCHCQAFLEYARSCAQKGLILRDWTTESNCILKCPPGMEYKTCVPACAQTCKSLNINQLCHSQCMDGCTCGDGKLLDGDTCVASSECSCMHMGKQYPAGSSISQGCHECICSHGKWECSHEDCPGECFVIGQSHFKSFDDKYFTFAGMCQYLLAKDCEEDTFAVFIEKVQCADDPDAVCIRSATLRFKELHSMTIKLKHGGRVSVNGMDIQPPLIQGALRIQHTVLSSIRVTYDEDFQFDWDGYGRVNLKLSAVYTGLTCGLCGNFNGNQGDDFLTPSGLVEPEMVNFGNSWKINGGCPDLKKIHADPCKLNPKRAKYAEEVCSVFLLTEFEPCHHEVNPAPFLKICRYDVCACKDGDECLCSAIASYAALCTKRGVLINWRSQDFCEMTCPDGQTYEQCSTPCNKTCRSISSPDTECTEFCLEGCYCPPEQFANEDGQCVPKSECPCYFNDEIYKPHENIALENVICYCENGVMHCSAIDLIHHYPPSVFSVAERISRVKRETSCQPPMRRFDCPEDDPTAKGIECMKTCQNYDLDCVSSKCMSGCMCPPGKVQVGTMCISPEMCSCLHNGKEYGPGETIKQGCNTCKCLNRKWHCTERVCDGTCLGIGEAHYITFDGLKYTFPGKCQYVLAQDSCGTNKGTFRILVEHSGCGLPGEECSKDITILYDEGVVELYDREVSIKKPFKNGADLQIFNSDLYYIIVLGNTVSILWDKGTRISIQVQGQYMGKLCGLCGNFDGNKNNDLLGSANQLEINPIDFGNSWTVKHLCADAIQPPPPCNGNSLKLANVENKCDLIKSSLFSECAKLVDPQPFWEICVFDACSCDSTGECLCLCNAIGAYAHECAQQGILVQWRADNLCPMSCEDLNSGQAEHVCEWRYNVCASACPRTCQHPEPQDCPVVCVEGCHAHCPSGTILDENSLKCIDPGLCPVCVVDGLRIPDGQTIVLNDGTERCQNCLCTGVSLYCTHCAEPTAEPIPTPTEETIEIVDGCHRVMELAFLIDGSKSFSKKEFADVKKFVLSMMEQMQIGQSNIRVAMLQFHSSISKQFDLWEKKSVRELKTLVKTMKYIGGSKSNLAEALKYTSVLVFGKDSRKKVPRVAILVTASPSSTVVKGALQLTSKRKVSVITVGIGANINLKEIGTITAKSPGGKSFILKNVAELKEFRTDILDYMCSRGARPSTPTPVVTVAPTTASTTSPSVAHAVITTPASGESKMRDVVFLLEASDKVGEDNFNRTKEFVIKMIEQFKVSEDTTNVFVIQYADTVSEEFHFTNIQSNWEVIERIKQMHFHGGEQTNTGRALQHLIESTLTTHNGAREEAPDLVFMITSNPPTDSITNPFNTVKEHGVELLPIVVGPDIDENIFPTPTVKATYDNILEIASTVYKECCQSESTTPATTTAAAERVMLPSSDLCAEPMDIIILLDGSENVRKTQFEEMKSFVKSLVKKVKRGSNATHISILQYGRVNTLEMIFNKNQEKDHLLDLINNIRQRDPGPSKIGSALVFAVQYGITEANGARAGVPKIAVILVTDTSVDNVELASQEAIITGVTVIPIGMGKRYDKQQILALAGPNPNNVIQLQNMNTLPMMVELSNEFMEKVCTATSPQECIDDQGNRRQAGEKWMLPDKCHSFICKTNGEVVSINHKVSCENLHKPTCSNNLPSIKIEETCGCRWLCPCLCTITAQTEMTSFDGLEFSLTGRCSYVLLQIEDQDTKIILHKGPCQVVSRGNCIKAIEIRQFRSSTLLHENMTVTINGKPAYPPLTIGNMDINDHGSSNFVANIPNLGLVLIFSPLSNLFGLWVSPSLFFARASGLCGTCDNNQLNDFELRDGSVAESGLSFINEWILKEQPLQHCTEEVPIIHECVSTGDQCNVLLSSVFEQCHGIVDPQPYLRLCRKKACDGSEVCSSISAYSFRCKLQDICVTWRSESFCPIHCPDTFVYEPCGVNCIQHCKNIANANATSCLGSPNEGCFCPGGKLLLEGKCVTDNICTQCLDEQQVHHQYLDTWIPPHDPCQLCMCLENRQINCTSRPCPAITVPTCAPCESPVLRRVTDECCPQYECLCDFQSCDLQPIPNCEDGSSLSLKNPGECKAIYECVCKRFMCTSRPIKCPPHRELRRVTTKCCDRYECVCSCSNQVVSCPVGYSVKSVINDCNCTTSYCEPNEVCVHNDVAYLVGRTWEESCMECSCTSAKDAITGLHELHCVAKTCNTNCPIGYSYREEEGACCGKCKHTVCEESILPRGDADPIKIIHQAGDQWISSKDPCIMNECLEVNGEAVLHEKNRSCSHIDVPKCPLGYELRCDQFLDCCPVCQCVPGNVCLLNGSTIGVGESVKVDDCTLCSCSERLNKYTLQCRTMRCASCPDGYIMRKENGSCCGTCVATMCIISLRNGTLVKLKSDEKFQDNCDSYRCKVNERGEFSTEKRTTLCMPFDEQGCKSGGGEIVRVDSSCCFTCKYKSEQCKKINRLIKRIVKDNCATESDVNIHHCEGHCLSKYGYSLQKNEVESECTCCSAKASAPILVPLRCLNGTVIQHRVMDVQECECVAHNCK